LRNAEHSTKIKFVILFNDTTNSATVQDLIRIGS
jgi:hypothetical protein